MSYMKAVCCWIKSDVKCSLSIVNKVFDKCFICYLCNKTSCNQFVIKCHFCFLSFHFSYCCSRSQRILQNFVLSLSRCSSNASDNLTIHASMIVRFPLVFSSLLAQICKPSLSAALLLPSLDNSQLPVCDLRCSLWAFAI